jgi:hypothetical protein
MRAVILPAGKSKLISRRTLFGPNDFTIPEIWQAIFDIPLSHQKS